MRLKIGNWLVKVEPILPEIGVTYHHKDRDPHDMIDHVIPQKVEQGQVEYFIFYKGGVVDASRDKCPVVEFNKWFRKGN
jgi:hypothetical protein